MMLPISLAISDSQTSLRKYFVRRAQTQKSIDSALKYVVIDLLQKDIDAQQTITSIVEKVDRGYERLLLGKAGWAIWAIIGMIVEGIIHSYFK